MSRALQIFFMVFVLLVTLSRTTAAAENPFIIGTLSSSIAAADVDQLLKLAEYEHSKPWIIEVQAITPEADSAWIARLYMIPNTQGHRVRRGVILECSGKVVEASKPGRNWTAPSKPGNYAQVAPGGAEFGETLSRPPPLEMPFQIKTQLADDELISLIAFIRGRAHKAPNPGDSGKVPTGPTPTTTGLERIVLVDEGSGFIRVWTEDSLSSGLVYSVSKGEKGWVLSGLHKWTKHPPSKSK